VRRLFLPFLTTLLLVCLTTGLGIWQLQRLTWKRDILARIEASERAAPVPLPADPSGFQKIIVHGQLDGTRAIAYLDDVRDDPRGDAVMGTHLVEPLLRPGQPPLLVDLGWVKYPPAPISGPAGITGYVRPAEHAGWMSAKDDPRNRRFYTLDPARIAAGVGLPAPLPYVVVALGSAGTPDPAHSLPRPPNDHLEYAVTWFSLALVATVMFLAWTRSFNRRTR